MNDLDRDFNQVPPTLNERRDGVRGVSLAENGNPDHGPYILFQFRNDGEGYRCTASFRDHEGFGGGATPREALQSLAQGLRQLADRVVAAADQGREWQRVKAAYLKPGMTVRLAHDERAIVRGVEPTHKDAVCVRLRGRSPLYLRWDYEVEVLGDVNPGHT